MQCSQVMAAMGIIILIFLTCLKSKLYCCITLVSYNYLYINMHMESIITRLLEKCTIRT